MSEFDDTSVSPFILFTSLLADVPTVVPTVTLSTNSEANNHQQPASRTMWQNESVVYSSLALNVLLVSLVIGESVFNPRNTL